MCRAALPAGTFTMASLTVDGGAVVTFKDDGKVCQSNNADQIKTDIPQDTWKSELRLVRSQFKGEQCSCSPLLQRLLHDCAAWGMREAEYKTNHVAQPYALCLTCNGLSKRWILAKREEMTFVSRKRWLRFRHERDVEC